MLNSWFGASQGSRDLQAFYFERANITKDLESALASGRHVLIYGPPRLGKTTLVRHILGTREGMTIHVSRDFGFSDISRNILLQLGCSVTVEQKRKWNSGAKAEISFKWPFVSAGVSADGKVDNEQTVRNFTAEINNPSDVCHILGQMKKIPILIIERFEQLKRSNRKLLLEFLRICAERQVLQTILIASSLDIPLEFRERLELARYLRILHLPPLSRQEMEAVTSGALAHLRCPTRPEIADVIYELFGGSLEAAMEVCTLVATKSCGPEGPSGLVEDPGLAKYLSSEFRDRTRDYLLALITAIIEEEWTVECGRLAQTSVISPNVSDSVELDTASSSSVHRAEEDEHSVETVSNQLIANSLSKDSVYLGLLDRLSESDPNNLFAALPLVSRRRVRRVYDQTTKLGKELLTCDLGSDAARFLAFAITRFIDDPWADFSRREGYVPAHTAETEEINFGRMICDILIAADLREPVIFTEDKLFSYLEEQGLIILEKSSYRASPFRQFTRRIRRLQRTLRVEPPIFPVDEGRTAITLWHPRYTDIFGDIKPDLVRIAEESEDFENRDE